MLIKQTYYDQAGLFMPLILMDKLDQTCLSWGQRYSTGFLNKKYSDQIIPLDEEPGVIGKVIDGFVPLDLRKSND